MLDRLKKLFSPDKPPPAPPVRDPRADGRWDVMAAEEQGEPLLRQRLAEGDARPWGLLTSLLGYYGRAGELAELRRHLAATAPRSQLTHLAHEAYGLTEESRLEAACFQEALVTRFPGDPEELERCASVLADVGRFDEAMTHFREAIRIGNPKPYFYRWPNSTIKSLTSHSRYDDAEELLRAYPDEAYALSPLALMLQVRGRTAEAEELLRERIRDDPARYPVTRQEILRLTLSILLERDGRADEAAVIRPAHGGFYERGRKMRENFWRDPATTPEQDRHQAIWSVIDDWSRGMAV
ncbi:hypothetical protein [Actinoplanes sp. G11-F43]|uniref:hypothetical protein n=1 Tax=Actinoplanes sp. G11-F43 TaxID=3424130 RepID=UPI003D33FEF3